MEPHTHKEPYTGVTIEEVAADSPREPFFTPPTPEADKPTEPSAPHDDVVGDGEEFEVVETEEMPAQPHEHESSDPHVNNDSKPAEEMPAQPHEHESSDPHVNNDSKPATSADSIPSSMGDSGGDTVVAE